MDTKLNEDGLLAHFDRLVEQGMVMYNQDYRTITLSDQGVPVRPNTCVVSHHYLTLTASQFEFRILAGLTNKPQAPRDQRTQTPSQQPGCRPGSDIDVSGYEVANLGSTHLLAFNKFPAGRPHCLILTQDGFRRQYEALKMDDLTAACQVLSSLESRHLLLFNCGIDSGCSRLHKHVHIFPAPDPDKITLWPDLDELKLPFKAFVHRFHNRLPPVGEILEIYQGLLRQAESALGSALLDGDAAVPHNVVMDRNWLVVIPRRAAGWDGADTNAAGMLGMIWVHSEEKVKIWLEKGPANVLAQIGVPAAES
jgi:ATP adenylyltransferase